jgi:hypothetical protein
MKKNDYSASELIEDLKYEIFQIIPEKILLNDYNVKMLHNGILPYNKLSLILCGYENRIKRIQRNIRINQEFKIARDELNEWEENLKLLFDLRSEKLINLINKYRESNNNLPISRRNGLKILNYHPKLKLDFFERINTKEKAYWLGFLWAEVYLGTRGQIKLEISQKDEILIDKFCKALDLNLKYKKYTTKIRKQGFRTYVSIVFRSIKIQEDLYKLGYVKSSKKSTIFPELDSEELNLAFLLGFFDGDGKEGTNQIHIASKEILNQVKNIFNIPHEIRGDKSGYFYLSLGGKLFNKMLANYDNSLERKRKIFRTPKKENLKLVISKRKLDKLIWQLPLKEIARQYNSYPRIIKELSFDWGIKKPDPHYWHRMKFKQLRDDKSCTSNCS